MRAPFLECLREWQIGRWAHGPSVSTFEPKKSGFCTPPPPWVWVLGCSDTARGGWVGLGGCVLIHCFFFYASFIIRAIAAAIVSALRHLVAVVAAPSDEAPAPADKAPTAGRLPSGRGVPAASPWPTSYLQGARARSGSTGSQKPTLSFSKGS